MSVSILQNEKVCYLCGSRIQLECHHIFAGTANRKISEKEGLKVWLCYEHHLGKDGAQYNKWTALRLKQDAQRAYEKTHSRDQWMDLIGKNYLG